MSRRRKTLLKATARDHLHTLARAGLSMIPTVGGPAAELFSMLIVPPLTKRRDEWLQALANGLEELEKKVDGFKVQSLVNNEAFVTMVMEASHLAMRNHAKEKVDALRNAVLNSALKTPDEYLQGVLLQFISIATPWHFRVLEFYSDPEAYVKRAGLKIESGDFLSYFVERIFPNLNGNDAFRLQVERDLLHYGLILPEVAWYTERTTDTGDAVLKMIATPLEGET